MSGHGPPSQSAAAGAFASAVAVAEPGRPHAEAEHRAARLSMEQQARTVAFARKGCS